LSLIPEKSSKKIECFIHIINLALNRINNSKTLSPENRNGLLESLKNHVEKRYSNEKIFTFFYLPFTTELADLKKRINELLREKCKEENYEVRGSIELKNLNLSSYRK